MKLFYTTRSPYARKVRVVALEKGIDLELQAEDLTAKSEELLSLNPVGKIPVLAADDGTILCDSSAICAYLEDFQKQPAMVPAAPAPYWRMMNLDAVAKGLTDITVAVFYEKRIHPQDFHTRFIANKEEAIVRTLEYLDAHLSDLKDFNMAAAATACAIGYIQFRVGHLWPQNSCQRLTQWYDEISQRESLQQTVPVA